MSKNRIIAIANEKGGVGKTATVLNLGGALSQRGKKVLIIDSDPESYATSGLGVKADDYIFSIYNLLTDKKSAKDAIIKTAWERLDLIPSNSDLAGIEVEIVNEEGRENLLKKALEPIKSKYDFILIDTQPSISLITVNALNFAKEALIPCQTHPYSYLALEELFDTIMTVKKEINPQLKIIGIVPTMFDSRTRVSKNILNKLQNNNTYKHLLFNTTIRYNTTIAESAFYGKPAVFFKQSSPGALDYKKLAYELYNRT